MLRWLSLQARQHARPLASQASAAKRRRRIGKIIFIGICSRRIERLWVAVLSERHSAPPWLKNGSGEDADPPMERVAQRNSVNSVNFVQTFPLCPPCSLTRSLPLISPFGPTFGCSISKAPPFRLWLNSLYSPPPGLFVADFDLFVAFFVFFLCVLGRRSYQKLR